MAQVRSWAGLDVHASKVVAVLSMAGPVSCARTGCRVRSRRWWRSALGCVDRRRPPMRRGRRASGWRARSTPRVSGARWRRRARSSARAGSGEDRRGDAERLVRLLMVGGLHGVRVPSRREEALRDLVRAREDVRRDLMRARHRMGKLLSRHDGAGENWTVRHRDWLGRVEQADRGAQVTLHDYVGAIDALVVRRDALEATIAELVPGSPWAQTVARLRCLRGIDTLTAVALCAEIGDFERFARAGQLASYLGVVPSEDSSGQRRRLGRDHQDRLQARPATAGRGGLALPPPTQAWHDARRPPARPTRARARARLEGPTGLAGGAEGTRSGGFPLKPSGAGAAGACVASVPAGQGARARTRAGACGAARRAARVRPPRARPAARVRWRGALPRPGRPGACQPG